MMKTKRKDYEKPAMQVVELRQQGYLLESSGNGEFTDPGNWNDIS